jgi:hypothetical protein
MMLSIELEQWTMTRFPVPDAIQENVVRPTRSAAILQPALSVVTRGLDPRVHPGLEGHFHKAKLDDRVMGSLSGWGKPD